MQDMELAIERLKQLKELGVLLAIDDFGTGYSSLNYVRRFPVDILKVDKSFIDEVADGGESSALTAAVIELAGILNLKPVAEGIERADQLERLMELNCDLGQGYFFARPLDPKALRSDARGAQRDARRGRGARPGQVARSGPRAGSTSYHRPNVRVRRLFAALLVTSVVAVVPVTAEASTAAPPPPPPGTTPRHARRPKPGGRNGSTR